MLFIDSDVGNIIIVFALTVGGSLLLILIFSIVILCAVEICCRKRCRRIHNQKPDERCLLPDLHNCDDIELEECSREPVTYHRGISLGLDHIDIKVNPLSDFDYADIRSRPSFLLTEQLLGKEVDYDEEVVTRRTKPDQWAVRTSSFRLSASKKEELVSRYRDKSKSIQLGKATPQNSDVTDRQSDVCHSVGDLTQESVLGSLPPATVLRPKRNTQRTATVSHLRRLSGSFRYRHSDHEPTQNVDAINTVKNEELFNAAAVAAVTGDSDFTATTSLHQLSTLSKTDDHDTQYAPQQQYEPKYRKGPPPPPPVRSRNQSSNTDNSPSDQTGPASIFNEGLTYGYSTAYNCTEAAGEFVLRNGLLEPAQQPENCYYPNQISPPPLPTFIAPPPPPSSLSPPARPPPPDPYTPTPPRIPPPPLMPPPPEEHFSGDENNIGPHDSLIRSNPGRRMASRKELVSPYASMVNGPGDGVASHDQLMMSITVALQQRAAAAAANSANSQGKGESILEDDHLRRAVVSL